MIIDATERPVRLSSEDIQRWADRHRGVGFDQLLLIENYARDGVLFAYTIYNRDGSQAEQCGNGVRCIARYLLDQCRMTTKQFTLRSPTRYVSITAQADGQISVDMGAPIFAVEHIPFNSGQNSSNHCYELPLSTHTATLSVLSMGNPHAVLFVSDVTTAPLNTVGIEIAQHPVFPHGVNVEFVQILSRHEAKVRVLERGAGETNACGSGACAAMVAGRLAGHLADDVIIHLPGGQLNIKWQGYEHPVIMTGPAVTVYHGEIA